MIRIAITAAAFEAIKAALPHGSVAHEPQLPLELQGHPLRRVPHLDGLGLRGSGLVW